MSRKLLTLLGLVAASLMMIEPALAGGGGGLPWEGPLEQIQDRHSPSGLPLDFKIA